MLRRDSEAAPAWLISAFPQQAAYWNPGRLSGSAPGARLEAGARLKALRSFRSSPKAGAAGASPYKPWCCCWAAITGGAARLPASCSSRSLPRCCPSGRLGEANQVLGIWLVLGQKKESREPPGACPDPIATSLPAGALLLLPPQPQPWGGALQDPRPCPQQLPRPVGRTERSRHRAAPAVPGGAAPLLAPCSAPSPCSLLSFFFPPPHSPPLLPGAVCGPLRERCCCGDEEGPGNLQQMAPDRGDGGRSAPAGIPAEPQVTRPRGRLRLHRHSHSTAPQHPPRGQPLLLPRAASSFSPSSSDLTVPVCFRGAEATAALQPRQLPALGRSRQPRGGVWGGECWLEGAPAPQGPFRSL